MTKTSNQESIRELLEKSSDLIPSMPDVVAKAMKLLQNPEADLADFERLLARDPPLVTNVLRLVNSPLHGGSRKRDTIREAIVGIGFKGLRGLLLCTTMKSFQGAHFACYGDDSRTLWRHAVAVATASRLFAGRVRALRLDPEELFVAGLLHDLGKLLLAPFLTKLGKNLYTARELAHVAEQRILGLHHQEAGLIVAAKWDLNPMLRAVIAHHHDRQAPAEHRAAVTVVRLMDRCATECGLGAGSVGDRTDSIAEDLQFLGLQCSQWDELRREIVEALSKVLADA
jgi:HD-like signal output (HDOD) protein